MENKLYGQRLKEARESAGLTQKGLADRTGRACTQENISKLERSKTAKGSAYTATFAQACGVRAIWLENGEGPMHLEQRSPDVIASMEPGADGLPFDGRGLTTRHRAMLGIFDRLTSSQQDEVMRELEKIKRKNEEIIEEFTKKRISKWNGS